VQRRSSTFALFRCSKRRGRLGCRSEKAPVDPVVTVRAVEPTLRVRRRGSSLDRISCAFVEARPVFHSRVLAREPGCAGRAEGARARPDQRGEEGKDARVKKRVHPHPRWRGSVWVWAAKRDATPPASLPRGGRRGGTSRVRACRRPRRALSPQSVDRSHGRSSSRRREIMSDKPK
jgi:hypothetical protein